MKKVLLGTTAIVAAGMIASAPASAASKIKMKVGGYMEQWMGYSSQDDVAGQDFSGFDIKSDAEVIFSGSTKLDNGITVGVNVQLEAFHNPADQIDESYLIVKGDFGEINIGSENSAQYKMHYGPSDFGIGINSGDESSWTSTLTGTGGSISKGGMFRAPLGSTYVEVNRANDNEKFTYYTPRVNGFQLGVSYAPNTAQDSNSGVNRDENDTDIISAGLNFKQKMGGVAAKASIGYGTVTDTADGTANDPTAVNAGIGIDAGGFGVGASFATFEDHGAQDGTGMNLGVKYSSGPMGVSLVYFHGERDGTGSVGAGTLEGQSDMDAFHLSAKYSVGPGVTVAGTIGHTTYTSDDVDLGNDIDEVSSTYVVVGIKTSF